MLIFRLFEVTMVFLTLWFIVSQVMYPAFRGTVLFPWFRKERELKATILEQHQELVEQQLEQTIAENDKVLTPSNAEDITVVTQKESM